MYLGKCLHNVKVSPVQCPVSGLGGMGVGRVSQWTLWHQPSMTPAKRRVRFLSQKSTSVVHPWVINWQLALGATNLGLLLASGEVEGFRHWFESKPHH